MTTPTLDDHTPAFMAWDLPLNVGTPDPFYGETEAHLWQDGRCGICGIHQRHESRQLALDHDHDTGLVRGLLCTSCNLQEGWQPSLVFHRWRSGMNPCAMFGWTYLYTGPGYAPHRITGEQALHMERLAAVREARLQLEMREAGPALGRAFASMGRFGS